jgi:hypothetical protein
MNATWRSWSDYWMSTGGVGRTRALDCSATSTYGKSGPSGSVSASTGSGLDPARYQTFASFVTLALLDDPYFFPTRSTLDGLALLSETVAVI